jgi:hypothetical protein
MSGKAHNDAFGPERVQGIGVQPRQALDLRMVLAQGGCRAEHADRRKRKPSTEALQREQTVQRMPNLRERATFDCAVTNDKPRTWRGLSLA